MSADAAFIKAICRQIRARLGSNHAAALAADCSPGVFSTYCSDDYPYENTVIPLCRLKLIANRREKAAIMEWFTHDDGLPAQTNLLTEVCESTEAAADLQRATREATRDRELTPLERRQLRGQAVELVSSASDVVAAIDEIQPGVRRAG